MSRYVPRRHRRRVLDLVFAEFAKPGGVVICQSDIAQTARHLGTEIRARHERFWAPSIMLEKLDRDRSYRGMREIRNATGLGKAAAKRGLAKLEESGQIIYTGHGWRLTDV